MKQLLILVSILFVVNQTQAISAATDSDGNGVIDCDYSEPNQDEVSVGPYTVDVETSEGVIAVNCFSPDIELIQEAVTSNALPEVWGRMAKISLPYDLFFNGGVDPRLPLSEKLMKYPQCNPGTRAVILRYVQDFAEIACSTRSQDLEVLRSFGRESFAEIIKAYLEKLQNNDGANSTLDLISVSVVH